MLAAVLRESLKRQGVLVVIDIRPCGDPADGQRRVRIRQRQTAAVADHDRGPDHGLAASLILIGLELLTAGTELSRALSDAVRQI